MPFGLPPGAHDPGVVVGNAGDDINALCLEGREVLDEAREVLG